MNMNLSKAVTLEHALRLAVSRGQQVPCWLCHKANELRNGRGGLTVRAAQTVNVGGREGTPSISATLDRLPVRQVGDFQPGEDILRRRVPMEVIA